MNNKYSVAIVGLGKSGFLGYKKAKRLEFFDEKINTHFSSIINSRVFKVSAGVDKSNKNLKKFNDIANIPIYKEIKDIEDKIDLFIVSTPAQTHLDVICEILKQSRPKFIICEKPLGINAFQTKKIITECKKNNVILIPFYPRLYDNDFVEFKNYFKECIKNEQFRCELIYNMGLKENGAHFLVQTLSLISSSYKFQVEILSNRDKLNPSFNLTLGNKKSMTLIGSSIKNFRIGILQLESGNYNLKLDFDSRELRLYKKFNKGTIWSRDATLQKNFFYQHTYCNAYNFIEGIMESSNSYINEYLEEQQKLALVSQKIMDKALK